MITDCCRATPCIEIDDLQLLLWNILLAREEKKAKRKKKGNIYNNTTKTMF
jgi:hypothetical protein